MLPKFTKPALVVLAFVAWTGTGYTKSADDCKAFFKCTANAESVGYCQYYHCDGRPCCLSAECQAYFGCMGNGEDVEYCRDKHCGGRVCCGDD